MLDKYKIGNRISLLRRGKGLTGEKFAEALGVSPQATSKWENGKCLPGTEMLPAIAALLGTSIDSILIPQELVILDARYTCGDSFIVVTDVLNRAVEGNQLKFKAACPIGGYSVEGPMVFVLTVKYQTPTGIYYFFAPQGEMLELDLSSKGLIAEDGFEIVGAYYGVGDKYKSVIHKMEHYEYFKWNEIHVNHETFPSSPGIDESEYLTLVYLNKNGIHVISCKENGVLRYVYNRTQLELIDTSTCKLPDIMPLEWGENNTMPCTWAGALFASLRFMGEDYTYEQIMGMSGACYRIVFCEVWDWSALDALVAFSYDIPLYNAIGYEVVWACRLDKDDRNKERKRIVADILKGKPIVAINLRVAPEWGVITGYSDNGKILYCRTYFDADKLNDNKDYLETENWPFLIAHFGEKRTRPSQTDILNASLRALVNSFEAPPRDGYFQGKKAYEKWIEGLLNDSLWDVHCQTGDINRRFDVHLSTVYQLIDARRCAAIYLSECCDFVSSDIAALLLDMANIYRSFTERLHIFKENLLKSGVTCFLGLERGKSIREEQVLLLKSVLQDELKNVETAKLIMRLMEEDLAIKNDDAIIKAVFNNTNCIYECTVIRSKPEILDGNTIVHITSKSPQEEVYLIEKTYGQNVTELYRYDMVRSYTQLIPQVYELDLERKMILKEDLSAKYIRCLYYDEDNGQGLFVRKNYKSILMAIANWHAAFWENHDAFSKTGLDWRFETKENLAAHISMMEKDFRKYRKDEEEGMIPKVWDGEFEGTEFHFENYITPQQLDYFEEAIEILKNEYWPLVESRFHTGKNITVIHGDLNPGAVYIQTGNDVKFDGLGAVRMGFPTEDLAMLIALHIEPDRKKSQHLLDFYYDCLCKSVKGYFYETFMDDYRIAVMENMFFTVCLINRGIYDFKMRDKAILAFESMVKFI